jgi:hypothetical protein
MTYGATYKMHREGRILEECNTADICHKETL